MQYSRQVDTIELNKFQFTLKQFNEEQICLIVYRLLHNS